MCALKEEKTDVWNQFNVFACGSTERLLHFSAYELFLKEFTQIAD